MGPNNPELTNPSSSSKPELNPSDKCFISITKPGLDSESRFLSISKTSAERVNELPEAIPKKQLSSIQKRSRAMANYFEKGPAEGWTVQAPVGVELAAVDSREHELPTEINDERRVPRRSLSGMVDELAFLGRDEKDLDEWVPPLKKSAGKKEG